MDKREPFVTHNEVPIYITDDGRFTFTLDHVTVTRSTIAAIKRELDKHRKSVPALAVDSYMATPMVATIEVLGRSHTNPRKWKVRVGGDHSDHEVYRMDQKSLDSLRAIAARFNQCTRDWNDTVEGMRYLTDVDVKAAQDGAGE